MNTVLKISIYNLYYNGSEKAVFDFVFVLFYFYHRTWLKKLLGKTEYIETLEYFLKGRKRGQSFIGIAVYFYL